MTGCCEPGCSAEVLCPVHQALSDLRAKIEALYGTNRTADWDYHRALDDVLDLMEKP
jgi:hypothetical protein